MHSEPKRLKVAGDGGVESRALRLLRVQLRNLPLHLHLERFALVLLRPARDALSPALVFGQPARRRSRRRLSVTCDTQTGLCVIVAGKMTHKLPCVS